MYIILIKDNHRYKLYTNEIFTTEKETLDYVERSKFKKNIISCFCEFINDGVRDAKKSCKR